MSNEIQTYVQKQTAVKAALTKAQGAILSALPKHLDPERMFRVYLTACNTSPGILDCEPISIVGAVMRAAAFGLSLETVTGEAFIIPRRNKNLGGRHAANFQIGYKGLRKLALQGDPELRDVFAYAVYDNDMFDYALGIEPTIRVHKPAPGGARGKLAQAYAVAVWKDSYRRFEVIDSSVIALAKRYAGGTEKPDSPWNTNEEAMWRKTALRRLCNQLALSSDVARELARGDGVDGHDALRERAQEDPSARAVLVELGGAGMLEAPPMPIETEQSALDRAADEAEQELVRPGAPAGGEPPRRARRPRTPETPKQGPDALVPTVTFAEDSAAAPSPGRQPGED